MRAGIAVLFLALALGCGSKETTDRTQTPQSERARDSVLGASNLPGAGGVRGALEVADSAAARRALEDSLAREP